MRASSSESAGIPVLDLGPYLAGDVAAREALARELCHIQENVGFYVVTNHGVPRETIDRGYRELERFFALPADAKLELRINTGTVGYIPPRSTVYVTSKVNRNTEPDLNETFILARERSPDHPQVVAGQRFCGPNPWPPGMSAFRAAMIEYQKAMSVLGYAMLPLYARALDLEADYFAPYFTEPMSWTRNSHYPAVRGEENQFGIAPHCDHSFMTLLPMSEVPGLEILGTDGRWTPAVPRPSDIIVNTGEFLNRWTNGRFLATPHRVVTPAADRYSMAMFFNPNADTVADPLPSCVSAERPAAFEPVSMLEYMCWYIDRNYKRRGGGAQA